ncbi:MAG TPA: hypothetical protein VMB49_07265 [Acidobacteriaceae bacterium]|nr:hypothetical protein [Acidobacteriaceae bacterium]
MNSFWGSILWHYKADSSGLARLVIVTNVDFTPRHSYDAAAELAAGSLS